MQVNGQSALFVANGVSAGTASNYTMGTTLTPSASAHTKGSYTQVVASTSADTCWIAVSAFFNSASASQTGLAIDLAVGAAASERIILPNISMSCGQQFGQDMLVWIFPCNIPAGSRLSARCQTNVASANNYNQGIYVTLFNSGFAQIDGATGADALGYNTATTQGTTVTPSATQFVKGSYAQITASTSQPYIGLMVKFDQQNAVGNGSNFRVDIATGAGGSEVILIPDAILSPQSYICINSYYSYIPTRIPAGTRLAARCTSATNSDLPIGVTLYGVYR